MVTPATSMPRLRVLVADDNSVNQLFAEQLLRKQGHMVQVVSNGRLALDAMMHNAFDVVLMDLRMPVMNGFDAVRELRQSESGTENRVPVIAITANASAHDRDQCRAVGMDEIISKPFQAFELAAAITRVLSRSRPSRSRMTTADFVDAEAPACDLTAALGKMDGDEEFLQQLAQLFLDTEPKQLESLKSAVEERDLQRIGDTAHSIKGSVRYFLAEPAYRAAQRLETISRTGDSVILPQFYEQLLYEVGRLRIELLAMLNLSQENSQTQGVM